MYNLKPSASLAKALLVWGIGVTSIIAIWWLLSLVALPLLGSKLSMIAFVSSYLVIGFWMTKRLARDLIDWNAIYGTVGNVASFKLWASIFWIVRWPIEFGKMAFSRW